MRKLYIYLGITCLIGLFLFQQINQTQWKARTINQDIINIKSFKQTTVLVFIPINQHMWLTLLKVQSLRDAFKAKQMDLKIVLPINISRLVENLEILEKTRNIKIDNVLLAPDTLWKKMFTPPSSTTPITSTPEIQPSKYMIIKNNSIIKTTTNLDDLESLLN